MTSLAIRGTRSSGQDVRSAAVTACAAVANVLRSGFGPSGLDTMLVDELGDVTVTNDGSTIVALLDVSHPAARVLVDVAGRQDAEVGDGTTSVVILAAELLRRANALVAAKIHPTNIIAGYRLAMREACKYIRDKMVCFVGCLSSLIHVHRNWFSAPCGAWSCLVYSAVQPKSTLTGRCGRMERMHDHSHVALTRSAWTAVVFAPSSCGHCAPPPPTPCPCPLESPPSSAVGHARRQARS